MSGLSTTQNRGGATRHDRIAGQPAVGCTKFVWS
jgi:hypothetical protein